MILTPSDIQEYERYIVEHREAEKYNDSPPDGVSVDFFARRPHLLLPLGFDETRPLVDPRDDPEDYVEYGDHEWFRRATDEAKQLERKYGINTVSFEFGIETLFRASGGGAWQWFEGLNFGELIFSGAEKKRRYSAEMLLAKLKAVAAYPDDVARTLWLPRIWSPEYTNEGRRKIGDDVSLILRKLQAEQLELREIHEHKLEELVAELLRSRGFSIHLTPKTRDGGRDIIAKADLGLGEPMTIAVEVKQKDVVGRGDLLYALKANENFPAIMLVTSGRFSAGVVEERTRVANHLRLQLKDGVALSQWIATYSPNNLR